MIKEYEIKTEKMLDTSGYMKRAFNIAKWLKKRYNLQYKNVTLTYYFTQEQLDNQKDKVIIKFEFHNEHE